MINRRQFASLPLLGIVTVESSGHGADPVKIVDKAGFAARRLREIERASRGRLGVCLLDTGSGASFGHRADERFPMCSTFKLMACAAALQRVDRGEDALDRRIPFTARDLVAYSPVTEKHAGGEGMTLAELCEATLTTSDNTAANLILASYGGPPRVTAFARGIGDDVTRLDRVEPALNEGRPGDPRDTTSPHAMAASVQRIVLGDALAPASRQSMERWLRANTTGGHRLRAGLPADWQVADKTGTSGSRLSTGADIGVLWPPGRAPWLAAVYVTQSAAPMRQVEAAIAEVARLVPQLAAR